MLTTPACENCENFDYNGLKCRKYPNGIPKEILYASLEDIISLCSEFKEEPDGKS